MQMITGVTGPGRGEGLGEGKSWVGSLQLMKICDDHPSGFFFACGVLFREYNFPILSPEVFYSYFHVTFW